MNNENTPTQHHTYNYEMLLSEIKTDEEALKLSDAISAPFALIERCTILLWDFIEDYFVPADKEELKFATERQWNLITAKIFSIHEQLMLAYKMLLECQDYHKKEL